MRSSVSIGSERESQNSKTLKNIAPIATHGLVGFAYKTLSSD